MNAQSSEKSLLPGDQVTDENSFVRSKEEKGSSEEVKPELIIDVDAEYETILLEDDDDDVDANLPLDDILESVSSNLLELGYKTPPASNSDDEANPNSSDAENKPGDKSPSPGKFDGFPDIDINEDLEIKPPSLSPFYKFNRARYEQCTLREPEVSTTALYEEMDSLDYKSEPLPPVGKLHGRKIDLTVSPAVEYSPEKPMYAWQRRRSAPYVRRAVFSPEPSKSSATDDPSTSCVFGEPSCSIKRINHPISDFADANFALDLSVQGLRTSFKQREDVTKRD